MNQEMKDKRLAVTLSEKDFDILWDKIAPPDRLMESDLVDDGPHLSFVLANPRTASSTGIIIVIEKGPPEEVAK